MNAARHDGPTLILGCSMRKRTWSQPVSFVSVYDGPAWVITRASRFPRSSIIAISARYGVLASEAPIMAYDDAPDRIELGEHDARLLEERIAASAGAFMFASRVYVEAVQRQHAHFPVLEKIVIAPRVGMLGMCRLLSDWLVTHGYKPAPNKRGRSYPSGLKRSLGHGR